jgi:hypothetical protein
MHGLEMQAATERRWWLSASGLFLFGVMLFAGAMWELLIGEPPHKTEGALR